jgi:hypothetical protein
MSERESQRATAEFARSPASHGDVGGIGAFSAPLAEVPSDPDGRPAGGISVVPIPRREIARLEGTLRLSELPRHKPAIVFDASRPARDTDDE